MRERLTAAFQTRAPGFAEYPRTERMVVRGRWVIILVVSVLLLFVELTGFGRVGAYGIVVVGALYNAAIGYYLLPRRPSLLLEGFTTATGDVVLTSVAIWLTGGLESPLFLAYFPLVITVALRNGLAAAIASSVGITALYMLITSGEVHTLGAGATLGIRLGFVWISALFTAMLAGRVRVAHEALEDELRRTQALHQASEAPASSLSLGVVLQAVAQQARALVDADGAAVRFFRVDSMEVYCRPSLSQEEAERCHEALERHALADSMDGLDTPAAGESALGVALRIGNDEVGRLIVGRGESAWFDPIDAEALMAFSTRAALALENAALYEDLNDRMAELERTQAQLMHSTKLAAIGQLAANVAHEINNPLTAVLMRVGLFLESGSFDEADGQKLRLMEQEVLRARTILRNLLDFARETELNIAEVNLSDVVRGTMPLADHRAELEGVRIEERHVGRLPRVAVDVNQFQQVLVNLVNNAVDSMEPGGTLKVETFAERGWVNVQVSDTGCGIPPDDVDRIFEPFFTTKPDVSGTGLGLSVSHGIVLKHGGTIDVDSELEVGSTFTVRLPQLTGPLSEMIVGNENSSNS